MILIAAVMHLHAQSACEGTSKLRHSGAEDSMQGGGISQQAWWYGSHLQWKEVAEGDDTWALAAAVCLGLYSCQGVSNRLCIHLVKVCC